MTKTKNITARKTGRSKATAKSRRRRLDAEIDYFNERFPIDLQTAQSLVEHISAEEFCYLVGRCGKKKYFTPALLRVLSRANRRRDERLEFLLKDLEAFLPELATAYTSRPDDLNTIMRRVRERVDEYNGPTTAGAFYDWVVPQIANTLKALDIVQKVELQNPVVFEDLYRRTYRAAWAGVLKVLKSCHHLGGSHKVAEEIVNITFGKIFADIVNWHDDGEASLPTRVRRFAEAQAKGWRTERIREKQRRGRLLGGVRRRRKELLYPTGAKKPSADVQFEL
jgi:hypothetical protein